LICIGGIHGNEPAGVQALEQVFKMIDAEPTKNPEFKFFGTLVGLRGNVAALKKKQRYINKDLNRQWTYPKIH